jgi:hypothetical protein
MRMNASLLSMLLMMVALAGCDFKENEKAMIKWSEDQLSLVNDCAAALESVKSDADVPAASKQIQALALKYKAHVDEFSSLKDKKTSKSAIEANKQKFEPLMIAAQQRFMSAATSAGFQIRSEEARDELLNAIKDWDTQAGRLAIMAQGYKG